MFYTVLWWLVLQGSACLAKPINLHTPLPVQPQNPGRWERPEPSPQGPQEPPSEAWTLTAWTDSVNHKPLEGRAWPGAHREAGGPWD